MALVSVACPARADNIYYTYTLQWTAPGDDSIYGRATAYDVRYSLSPITDANWNSATIFPGMTAPLSPGSREGFTLFGLDARFDYYVAIRTVDGTGNRSKLSNVLQIHTPMPAASGPDSTQLALLAPWPNPAGSETHLQFLLPREGPVEIDALDIAGRRVRALARGQRQAGRTEMAWDLKDNEGHHVAPGIYLIRARLLDKLSTRTVAVVH
jgi:hypothetical protein